ncbi:ABC transporter ATP-binding protein [Capsulimonas corticalis]|uniref:ABC transporter ATP-binding protein n=1 Tax=Capsulimonas corticalis TaxID=2219043 RepID=A0A402CSB7_9BACT|nr:ABC transporter ATP-binding protein [Capsulimonas corticalis]BDI28321.1 ABC transporter ATP-binding protein [Capsulimonas corticalis]
MSFDANSADPAQSEEIEAAAPEQSRIVVKDLKYQVSGKQVLKGIDLEVNPGEILCVMGMSGCGKTTLLHCIGGLTRASSGEIWIGDSQIVGMAEDDLNHVRERMGMVFQYAALFDSLTVYENVAFGLMRRRRMRSKQIREIVSEKLALVGLPGTESLHPSELSGGMAKRVGLARAIAMAPEMLLYDEPTSGLDPVVASVVDELIMQMRDKLGVTSIVVSHNITSIFRISDKIAMLHEGEVLVYGSPDEIKSSKNPIVQQFILGHSHGPIEVAHR